MYFMLTNGWSMACPPVGDVWHVLQWVMYIMLTDGWCLIRNDVWHTITATSPIDKPDLPPPLVNMAYITTGTKKHGIHHSLVSITHLWAWCTSPIGEHVIHHPLEGMPYFTHWRACHTSPIGQHKVHHPLASNNVPTFCKLLMLSNINFVMAPVTLHSN